MFVTVNYSFRDGRAPRTETLKVNGPDDGTELTAGAFLQLGKLLSGELGSEQINMYFGGDVLMSYGSAAGQATAAVATPDTHDGARELERVQLPFQIRIPIEVLRKRRNDAVMFLRLGAIANALQTVLRLHAASSVSGTTGQKDLIHVSLIAASYLKEACDVLRDSGGRAWQLAERGVSISGDLPIESLADCRVLMAPFGPLERRIKRVRHFYGFHIDPRNALEWLNKVGEQSLILQMVEEPRRADITFVASTQMLADLCSEAQDKAIFTDATRLQLTLPYLIERMLVGFLDEQGIPKEQTVIYDFPYVFRE